MGTVDLLLPAWQQELVTLLALVQDTCFPVSCPLASRSTASTVWLKIFVLCGGDLEKHGLGLQCFSVLAWGPTVI